MTYVPALETSFSGGFWQLIQQAGIVAKLVLLSLLAFSVLSWGIILNKWRAFRNVTRQSQRFYAVFKKSHRMSDVYGEVGSFPLSPLAGVFKAGYEELEQQVRAGASVDRGLSQSGQDRAQISSYTPIQRALQKSASAEMTALESSLNWLATTGAVTPFIGLFGTVIGIINAFQGLGLGSASTIQAVAPGISEALVTTAAGLFAAIPAVIGYNHFVHRLKVFGAEIDDFSMEFLNTVERSFAAAPRLRN